MPLAVICEKGRAWDKWSWSRWAKLWRGLTQLVRQQMPGNMHCPKLRELSLLRLERNRIRPESECPPRASPSLVRDVHVVFLLLEVPAVCHFSQFIIKLIFSEVPLAETVPELVLSWQGLISEKYTFGWQSVTLGSTRLYWATWDRRSSVPFSQAVMGCSGLAWPL